MKPEDIVFDAIKSDLTGRSGIGNSWEACAESYDGFEPEVKEANVESKELKMFSQRYEEVYGTPPFQKLLDAIAYLGRNDPLLMEANIQLALEDWRDVIAAYDEQREGKGK